MYNFLMKDEKLEIPQLTTEFKSKQVEKKSYVPLIVGLVTLVVSIGLIIGIIYGVSLAKEAF